MSQHITSEEIYLPGQPILATNNQNKSAGDGTYCTQGLIRASLVGRLTSTEKVDCIESFIKMLIVVVHLNSEGPMATTQSGVASPGLDIETLPFASHAFNNGRG